MREWRAYVRSHLPTLDIPPERELEIVDELALQLEAAHDAAIARGATEQEARAAALAEVPDWQTLAATLVHIERRVASRLPAAVRPSVAQLASGSPHGGIMAGFMQDVRYAVRTLLRAPGFAAVAIVTLALGIGATTIVYSLIDGILLRPLAIREPDRVVLAREVTPAGVEFSVAWMNFVDWQARAKSFEALGAWRGLPANLTDVSEPRRILVRQVTWNLFDVLGVQPVLGRGLRQADEVFGAPRVCLISYTFWQRQFGADPAAIGQQVTLDDERVTIVGVLPRDFTVAREEDAFLPLGNFIGPTSPLRDRGNHNGLAAVGRLARGVSLESARAELGVIASQLGDEYPNTNKGGSAAANLLFEVLVRQARPALRVLAAAVAAMLLIACVNIANLLLVRGTARAHEIEVRRALGAERWRLLRPLLTESALLAIVGGAGGVLLSYAGLGVFVALLPPDQPRIHQIAIDGRVLAFASAASIAAGLLFGFVPALQAGSRRALSLLRGRRVAGSGGPHGTTRRVLLVTELSLALVLLVSAGLMVRTIQNLFAVNVGFEREQVLSAQVSLPSTRYTPEHRRVFYAAVEERVRSLPGVTNAAFTLSLPVGGSNWNSVFIAEGQSVPTSWVPSDLPSAAWTPISPSYFRTMGIRLLRGRDFTAADSATAPTVTVVNESLARRFWPNEDPIGKRIKQGWPNSPGPWREIIGVVNDVKTEGLDQPIRMQAYLPIAQQPTPAVALVVRSDGNPLALRPSIEAAVRAVDPNLPIYDVRTLTQLIEGGVGSQRLLMILLLGFGGLALLLAAVGVFGVNAYAVSQRTHELGIRIALGADRRRVLGLVLRQGLATCAIGNALGLVIALTTTRVLTPLLYQVTPSDPATLAGVTGVLLIVTALACYLPALRATKVDPVTALRAE